MDPTSDDGLADLNAYLATRSYMAGYSASTADVKLHKRLLFPDADRYPHASRWWNHISALCAADAAFATLTDTSREAQTMPATSSAATDQKCMDKSEETVVSIVWDVQAASAKIDWSTVEKQIRQIHLDGLTWAASALVPQADDAAPLLRMVSVLAAHLTPTAVVEQLKKLAYVRLVDWRLLTE